MCDRSALNPKFAFFFVFVLVLVFILVFVFVFYLCFYFFLYLYLCLCLFLYLFLYLLPHKWQQEEANVWEVIGECALNFVSNLYLVLNSTVCRALKTHYHGVQLLVLLLPICQWCQWHTTTIPFTWIIVRLSVLSFLFSRPVLPFFYRLIRSVDLSRTNTV